MVVSREGDEIFKVMDWTELAIKWGVTIEDQNDSNILQELDRILSESISLYEIKDNQIIDDAREFLSVFTRNEMHKKPLFLGLLEIKDDHTFIKYFRVLLPHMWV